MCPAKGHTCNAVVALGKRCFRTAGSLGSKHRVTYSTASERILGCNHKHNVSTHELRAIEMNNERAYIRWTESVWELFDKIYDGDNCMLTIIGWVLRINRLIGTSSKREKPSEAQQFKFQREIKTYLFAHACYIVFGCCLSYLQQRACRRVCQRL